VERLSRLPVIVTVVVVLGSCGVFFAPIEGRWNIKDPGNELSTFNPTIDGYAHSTTPLWEGSVDLLAWPTSKIILLRFDTADFPDVVAASYLRLTVKVPPSPDAAELSIYRIRSDWDTSSMSYAVADDPVKFYDGSAVARYTIPTSVKAREDIQIPVTGVYSGSKDNLSNGILIYSSVDMTFDSTETGTAPLLSIEPE
jgi:hypothetical protein